MSEMTCIICPLGCSLKAERLPDGNVRVTGNTCARGEAYAKTELTAPVRTLTTTVRVSDGRVLSVKTDRPVPKGKIFDCMAEIKRAPAYIPRQIGDILLENVAGTGANVIFTKA